MKLRTAAFLAFGVATIPLAAAAYLIRSDLDAPPAFMTPRGHTGGGIAVGDDRFDRMAKLTSIYAKHNPHATAGMRDGTELAPPEFLNQELKAEGEKWRVRTVDGLVAETYNIT